MTGLTLAKLLLASAAAVIGAWVTAPRHGAVPFCLTTAALAVGMVVVSDRRQRSDSTAVGRMAPQDVAKERSERVRALVVGAGGVGQSLAAELQRQGRYEIVGFVDDEIESPGGENGTILGRRSEIPEIVRRCDIGEVFLAYAPSWQQRVVEDLAACDHPVRVSVVPTSYEALLATARVRSAGDIALVQVAVQRRRNDRGKRALDAAVAAAALAALSPIMALVSIAIRLTSRGPAIFAQERVGLNGRLFTVFKFRTMVVDAETASGPVLASGLDDTRLTSIGRWLRRFRIDELPQLWNVLRGDMSLVGPRPERPFFVEAYTRDIPAYAQRHTVRPGITGLAQVRGGYHTDARDKLRFDLIYVAHQNLWMDLSIVLQTVGVVFRAGE